MHHRQESIRTFERYLSYRLGEKKTISQLQILLGLRDLYWCKSQVP